MVLYSYIHVQTPAARRAADRHRDTSLTRITVIEQYIYWICDLCKVRQVFNTPPKHLLAKG